MAKFYVLNAVARSGKTGYGSFVVAGSLVMPGVRHPLEESQLEAEYDHIHKLWKDGVIEIRESATGKVFTFPEKSAEVQEQAPQPEAPAPEPEPEPEPDDVPDLPSAPGDNVVPMRKPELAVTTDSAAEAPLQDLLDGIAEDEPEPEPEPDKKPPSKPKGKKGKKGKKG